MFRLVVALALLLGVCNAVTCEECLNAGKFMCITLNWTPRSIPNGEVLNYAVGTSCRDQTSTCPTNPPNGYVCTECTQLTGSYDNENGIQEICEVIAGLSSGTGSTSNDTGEDFGSAVKTGANSILLVLVLLITLFNGWLSF